MINEEIKHIVQAEFQDGEELLWAEKTTSKAQQDYAQTHKKEGEVFKKIRIFFLRVCAPVILVTMIFIPSFRIWGGIFLVLMPLSFLSNEKSGNNTARAIGNLDIGGYALTNLHLFELNRALEITKREDASKLKKVSEEVSCILARPVGSGLLKIRNLDFLNNNYVTTNFINNQLDKRSNQSS